jgi:hypothetical protein
MGYFSEPRGVDFVVKSKPLTKKDREEISKLIADYKAKNKTPKKLKTADVKTARKKAA